LLSFFINKLIYGIPVIAGVVTIVFWLFQGLGNPERVMMGQSGDSATLQHIRKELHLDQPRWKQFALYLNDVSPISYHSRDDFESLALTGFLFGKEKGICIKWPYLRKSYHSGKNVSALILDALPGTLLLTIAAMLLASFLGVTLGVIAAVKKDTIWDSSTMAASIAGVSVPSFFMAILMAWIFGFLWSDLTGLSMTGSWKEMDFDTGKEILRLDHLILPAITLGIRPLAIITQLTRSVLLEELGKDYIQTAYAKGLKRRTVVMRHALRNALNPVATAITGWLAELLAGAFFIEYIFGWKGLGKLTVEALEQLDYPLVMGSVLVSSIIFIGIGIITDLVYLRLDPRVRIQ
jgi:peptide/nickel transport system permease protein